MSELYRIKIQVPEGIIEREDDTEKRMKADGDYVETGWRVLGVPFGGPIVGRDLDGEAFTPETDIWLKVGDKVNLTYYHGFDPDTRKYQHLSAELLILELMNAGIGLSLYWTSKSLWLSG